MQPLSPSQIEELLPSVEGWQYQENALCKSFIFKDFRRAIAFMVQVGFEAEELGHHPEMTNVYNRVALRLTTHDAGNCVTHLDMQLAEKINQL